MWKLFTWILLFFKLTPLDLLHRNLNIYKDLWLSIAFYPTSRTKAMFHSGLQVIGPRQIIEYLGEVISAQTSNYLFYTTQLVLSPFSFSKFCVYCQCMFTMSLHPTVSTKTRPSFFKMTEDGRRLPLLELSATKGSFKHYWKLDVSVSEVTYIHVFTFLNHLCVKHCWLLLTPWNFKMLKADHLRITNCNLARHRRLNRRNFLYIYRVIR